MRLLFCSMFILFSSWQLAKGRLFFEQIGLNPNTKALVQSEIRNAGTLSTDRVSLCSAYTTRSLKTWELRRTVFWIDHGQCHFGKLLPSIFNSLRNQTQAGNETVYISGYLECPASHPFALGNEMFCCASKFKNFYEDGNLQCNGKRVLPVNPVECCPMGNYVRCSTEGRLCRSANNVNDQILLARQDIRDGVKRVFDVNNYLDMNKENFSAALYSRLFQLEDFRQQSTGEFHFKLCYPMLTDTASSDSCWTFKQTSNPFNITSSTETVEGFEVIEPLYTQPLAYPFSGLRSDTKNRAFLDGNPGTPFWSSILLQTLETADQVIPVVNFQASGSVYSELVELFALV